MGLLGNGHWAGLAGFYSHVGSDTIDFRFRFLTESPSLLSAYFRLRPKVEFPLSVDL